MIQKKKKWLILTIMLAALFILFTLSLKIVDIQAIGPNDSKVSWASLNGKVFDFFGYNKLLFDISDWLGVTALVIGLIYLIIGILQIIKRKSLFKVDFEIIALGGLYLLVIAFYIMFELVVINCRPILTGGTNPAPSYPSSTSFVLICLSATSMIQTKRLLKNSLAHKIISLILLVITVFTVAGRLISRAHWLTDIIGGILLSFTLVSLYCFAISTHTERKISEKFN